MPRILADTTPLRESVEFRRLWWGLGLSNIGSQLTIVSVGLQVYDLTSSTLAVGVLGFVALIPLVVLGLYGGALVDLHDRRTVALVASCVAWVATIAIATQAWLGINSVWLLYALVAVQSGAAAVNSPARTAIIPRLIAPQHLAAANALNTLALNVALMGGPLAGAALVSTLGFAPTYTVDVVTFTFGLYALLRLRPVPPLGTDRARPTGWRSVAQGLRFLATRPNVRMTFLIDLAAMVLARPQVLLPAVGVAMIGGGATTTGVLTAAVAAGAVLMGIFSGPLTPIRAQGKVIAIAVAAWGLCVALFGLVLLPVGHTHPATPIWWALILAVVILAVAGAADTVSAVFRSTILQSATPDDMRGRLQGVFIVVVTGGPRLGELVGGIESTWVKEAGAAIVGGLSCMLAVALLMRINRGFLRYDAEDPTP